MPDHPPVPDREMLPRVRQATRTLLVDHAAAGRRAAGRSPVPVFRRRPVLVTPIVVLALAAALLWPLPANHAFAAWSPVPAALDGPTAVQVGQWCSQAAQHAPPAPGAGPSAPEGRWRPVLVDRRGNAATALVLDEAGSVARCMYPAVHQPGLEAGPGFETAGISVGPAAPRGAHTITVQDTFASADQHNSYGGTHGQAAPTVARMMIILDDGTQVQASLANGWYLAWWPNIVHRSVLWRRVDHRWPVTINAYDAAGHLLQHLPVR